MIPVFFIHSPPFLQSFFAFNFIDRKIISRFFLNFMIFRARPKNRSLHFRNLKTILKRALRVTVRPLPLQTPSKAYRSRRGRSI
jgi:hypothetical protein